MSALAAIAERPAGCLLCKGADDDLSFDFCRACGRQASAHRGPGYRIGRDNREAVRTYFLAHVGCTNREAAKALGLSEMAVGRHVATLRAAWLRSALA